MVSVLNELVDQVSDGIRSRFCTNTDDMIRRIRWAFQNFPLALPSAPSLISSLIPIECNQVPRQPPTNRIPGGQCPGVLYRVTFNRIRPNGQVDPGIQFQNVVGPITNLAVRWERVGAIPYKAAFIVLTAPNDTEYSIPGRREFGPSSYDDEGEQTRVVLQSISRMDGQADTCGDGEPVPEQPEVNPPPAQLPPINIQIGPNSVQFSPTFSFSPAVNLRVNGTVSIPVNVDIAPNIIFPTGISFPIYLDLPDLTVNQTISGPFITVENNPGGGGGGTVQLQEVQRLIGVRVQSTLTPDHKVSTIVDSQGGKNLYVPRLATVRFVPPAWVGEQLSVDLDVKTLDQFVPVPWFYGASGFDVFPSIGISTVTTPIFAKVADLVKPV